LLEEELKSIYENLNHSVWNDKEISELGKLELKNKYLLLLEEESWRQKSIAIWIEKCDSNAIFFHQYANHRRNFNSIWEIADSDGHSVQGQKLIEKKTVSFFSKLFDESGQNTILDQLRVIILFPCYFNGLVRKEVEALVTLKEVKDVLKNISKDKSPGPDGWTVDFFIHFFELLGVEILEAVEESKILGSVCGGLNSTFIALIAKSENPLSFVDYQPILICNMLYKLITKIIADRLKLVLSLCLSRNQFSFLENRQIVDVVSITQ